VTELPRVEAASSERPSEGAGRAAARPGAEDSRNALRDHLVFSTDYPHIDSRYPEAVDAFLELPISDDAKRRILWDNCARFYSLDVEPEVAPGSRTRRRQRG